MLALAVACIFAAILGFAAHRASICTVRAVAEIMSARTAYMLVSVVKSAVWVLAVIVPFLWLMPHSGASINGWQLTAAALAGGLLFGIGAAINGACAYSTMARLVDGEVGMVLTLCGFAIGVIGFGALLSVHWVARPAPDAPLISSMLDWAGLIVAVVLAWAIYEAIRVWRTTPGAAALHRRMLAPQYRLSSAAIVIGVASSIIFLLIGSPGYTATIQNLIEGYLGTRAAPKPERWILLLAVLAGMFVSTLQRGSFRLDWTPRTAWGRNVAGGALMGLGTAMLPGGNDALVLYGVPSFSPHALPSYVALILGAALGLLVMRHAFGLDTRVNCRDDIYRADQQPRGSILNAHAPRE